jgi:hypothetical protein
LTRRNAVKESEWDSCADPQKMLLFLRDRRIASDRKLRLFACAFGRAVRGSQHLLGPSTVVVAERYADGLANDQDMASERRRWACSPEEWGPVAPSAYDGAWQAVDWLTGLERRWRGDPDSYFPIPAYDVLKRSVLLLRDIFGNLFRTVPTIDPSWLKWNGGTVAKLVEAAYEHRSLPEGTLEQDRLAVLADALEEAGCSDTELLAHLRSPGPHVRGCHVIDLLLGRG